MRNIKLLIRKYGFLSLILLIVVIVGGDWEKILYRRQKSGRGNMETFCGNEK